jgi:acetoin utilization protein AcuB
MTSTQSDITINKFAIKEVITIPSGSSIGKAVELMSEFGIRHIPILEEGKVIGLINPDCIIQSFEDDLSTLNLFKPVEKVMCSNYNVASPDDSLFDVVRGIAMNPYSATLVMDNEELCGIYTDIDILDTDFLWMNFTDLAIMADVPFGQTINEFTCATTHNTIGDTLKLMIELHVDHIGIVEGDSKHFTGVLGFFDMINHLQYVIFKKKNSLEEELKKPIITIFPRSGLYFTEPVLLSEVRRQMYVSDELFFIIMNRTGKAIKIISVHEIVNYLIEHSDYFPEQ